MKKKVHAITAAVGIAVALAANADAVTNVTITGVTQRWPWNNKIDISYTVEGGQARASGVYCGLRFAFTANGQTYDIPGYSVGASAETGPHTVTWNAPKGIVTSDGSLTATLFTTNVPSGNDYMIVDLLSGNVYYEGLFADPNDSNSRYNTGDTYKTTKMVLRKIPKWADRASLPNADALAGLTGYPTGDSAHYSTSGARNSDARWATSRDYYVGVFLVTQDQYVNMGLTNPSTAPSREGTKPVEAVSWDDLRLSTTASTSSIPAVASSYTGTFFQRLNYKTGLYFDLPTEVMSEIAERAGATTTFYWGDTMNAAYVVYSENSGGSTVAVGSRLPNDWGLYDAAGNVYEHCLDDASVTADLKLCTNAFQPAWNGGTNMRHRGGGYWYLGAEEYCRASFRNLNRARDSRSNSIGFRVYMIAN